MSAAGPTLKSRSILVLNPSDHGGLRTKLIHSKLEHIWHLVMEICDAVDYYQEWCFESMWDQLKSINGDHTSTGLSNIISTHNDNTSSYNTGFRQNQYMIFDPYLDPAPIRTMSYIPALRTYTFISPAAAQTFLPFYKNVARTLKANYNVGTTGVYHSKTNPAQIIALVRYPSDSNPEEIIKSYLTSGALAKDVEGNDMKSNVESVEEVILEGPLIET